MTPVVSRSPMSWQLMRTSRGSPDDESRTLRRQSALSFDVAGRPYPSWNRVARTAKMDGADPR